MAQSWRRTVSGWAAVLTLWPVGCAAPSRSSREVSTFQPSAAPLVALARPIVIQQTAHQEAAESTGGTLSLTRLIELAERNNPDLAAARAAAAAAQGRLVQAGLYPNPSVGWQFDEVGHNGNQLGEQGPNLSQTFVTGGKLRLDQAAAAQALAAAQWQALTRWYGVLTRVRIAYYELLAAQREVQTSQEIVRLAEEGLTVAQRLRDAGTGTKPDVIRAQVELDGSTLRLGVARQREEAARRLVAVATGLPAFPAGSLEGSLEAPVPIFEWDAALQSTLTRSSELHEARANVLQAEQLLQRAYAQNKPDVQLGARPFYVFPENDTRVTLQVGFTVPLFNRNQGNIAAAQADLARTQEEVRQVQLRLTERLTGAFQRYRNARLQTESYQKQILPNARESLRLVRLGYEKGDPKYDYTAVLQAQQTLVQAQLTYVQALGELWRAVSEIAGLLQQDEW